MSGVANIQVVDDLRKYLGKNDLIEIVIRNQNGRIRDIQKAALNNVKGDEVREKVNNAIALMNQNVQMNGQILQGVQAIQGLQVFNLVLSGVNLCATCAGFAIMYVKLDGISDQITTVVKQNERIADRYKDFELRKVLSEHSDMLDHRKTQKYYTEEQMRVLVDKEANMLEMLIDTFRDNMTADRKELAFSVLSLATMFATSLRYFDEAYYFNNQDVVTGGQCWHNSHEMWMKTLEKLLSDDFIKEIQDLGYFDLKLDTLETDCFYKGFYDQIMSLKIDIENNQKLLVEIDSLETLKAIDEISAKEIKRIVESALEEAEVPAETKDIIMNCAVA